MASAPDFERADEGSILTAGLCFKSGKSECNNSGYKTNWSNLVAVMDWGGANSRLLGLVSVWGSTIIRSNGIETVCHQKNPSN